MRKMVRKIAAYALVFFLLFSTLALAQVGGWDIRILSSLLGEMPRVCKAAVTPQCFSCLIYTKFFPLLFFLAIFFLTFFYVIKLMRPTLPRTPLEQLVQQPPLATVEMKVITILSLIFSLILLNILSISTILSQLLFWLMAVIFVFGLMLARSFFRVGGVISNLASIIIVVIVLVGIWAYVGAPLSATIGNWIRMCT